MGDGGVGQEPLHVGLAVGSEVAQRAGDRRHQRDHRNRKVSYGRKVGHDPCRRFPGRHAQGIGDTDQECYRRRLAGHRQKGSHFGRRPFEDVGAPEVEGHRRQFEGQPHRQHEPSEGEHHHASARRPCLNDPRQFIRHARQVAGAQHACQQADAVEHDSRRPSPIHGILDRRLRGRPPPLQDPCQRVGGDARHLDGHEHHQEVIGRCHQAHAECGSQHERVKVGAVLAVGNPRNLRKHNIEYEKAGQDAPQIGCERVEDEQAGEDLNAAAGRRGRLRQRRQSLEVDPGIPQGEGRTAKGDECRVEQPEHRQHAAQQQQHDRCRQRQFRTKQRQRNRERVVERARKQRPDVHWVVHLPTSATATGAGASCTSRVQAASVCTCRFTVGVT